MKYEAKVAPEREND